MRIMTASEASRRFAAVLDEAERGETIVVTRGGQRVALIGPAASSNGRSLVALTRRWSAGGRLDADLARDVTAARDAVELDEGPW